MLQGKVLVAQGGGPTAVINQSLVGAVLEARKFRNVSLVYGALNGVRGIVDEELVDLTQETTNNLEMVGETPSSALGSTRDKPDLKYCRRSSRYCRRTKSGISSTSVAMTRRIRCGSWRRRREGRAIRSVACISRRRSITTSC